ncbi:MerR family transcriptional regulator [Microbispora amethystogenes]|uniref:MerR family transcriptional regulator n=1 Tax=Microbispora amethystogenes TaxID=1427754 RepID=UPI0033FCB319
MRREGQPETDGDAVSEEEPGYGIGAVARRLGVPASTLRTWNLRYGIGPSRRSPGGHRRYDEADLRRLQEMNRLVRSGMPPADAANLALRQRPAAAGERRTGEPAAGEPRTGRARTGEARTAEQGAAEQGAFPAGGVAAAPGRPARRPARGLTGGPAGSAAPPESGLASPPTSAREVTPRVTPELPAAEPGLLSAAMLARVVAAMDAPAVSVALDAALAAHGVLWTWERLVLPVFAAISRRQQETGAGIDIEHLFSNRLQAALVRFSAHAPAPVHPRPVLLAAAEEEQHTLAIQALAAALGGLAVETRVLGARTPYSALADAMRRVGPAAVFVWSQTPETGDPAPLGGLPGLRPACRIIAGGPGWGDGVPTEVVRVTTFRDAISAVMTTLR